MDIFRAHGPAYRRDRTGHLNLAQLKVMSAIETCRTAALGGHVVACTKCGHQHIAYNSCRNRHCPKCQGATARDWMQARMEDLLPVEYFHVVFTLPAPIAAIAYQNKAAVYGLLFRASAQTLLTIAADPKHLGAQIGMTSVLHTWGSAMTHHPHVHVVVPGGGVSTDGTRWIGCRPGFFLPVKVLSRLFRRLFMEALVRLHRAGKLRFFGNLARLADPDAFAAHLAPLRKTDWVVYAKPPFGGPAQVLAYLSRYTLRVAISNHRLISSDPDTVAFQWKDYRIKRGDRMKVMRLPTHEFIRRFLTHVLPSGFHRIRHAGFLANGIRRDRIETIRHLIHQAPEPEQMIGEDAQEQNLSRTCPKCGGPMRVIELFTRGQTPKSRAPPWEDAARSTHHTRLYHLEPRANLCGQSVGICATQGSRHWKEQSIREDITENTMRCHSSAPLAAHLSVPIAQALSHNPHSTEIRPRFPPCQIYRRCSSRRQKPQTLDFTEVRHRLAKGSF